MLTDPRNRAPRTSDMFMVKIPAWLGDARLMEPGDLLLITKLEPIEMLAAPWRRELQFMRNGVIHNCQYTEFKRLIRDKELELML